MVFLIANSYCQKVQYGPNECRWPATHNGCEITQHVLFQELRKWGHGLLVGAWFTSSQIEICSISLHNIITNENELYDCSVRVP